MERYTTTVYYQYKTTKTINGVTCYYYTNSSLTTCLSGGYNITVPTKTNYGFGGYYSGTNGSGTQYVTSSGGFTNNIYQKLPSEINSSYTTTITLYAKWTIICCPNGGHYYSGYCYKPVGGTGAVNVGTCGYDNGFWVENTCYSSRYKANCLS